MSNAKLKFEDTIVRCNRIVDNAKTSSDCSDDMLRFAVVLAVAAFDSYVADLFSEPFVSFVKDPPDENKAVQFLQSISFGTKEMLALLCARKERPFRTIHAAVDRYLATKSFQSEQPIKTLFSLYGLPNLFRNSANKAGGKRVETRVRNLIKRRHEIVHACDVNSKGKLREIERDCVQKWIDALARLVSAMDEIVGRRLQSIKPKKFRRKRISATQVSQQTRKPHPIQ